MCLAFDDGPAKTSYNGLDHILHFERKARTLYAFDGEAGDPFPKFLCDLSTTVVAVLFCPLKHAPFNARAKWFHNVISQWCTAFPRQVADAKSRVQPDGEQLLQHDGKQDCVAVVEEIVEAPLCTVAHKLLVI